jgi:prepilin-type N-terminal cleavage/methylation domain-containing protein
MNSRFKKNAFTLIELGVAIGIIGILVSAVFTQVLDLTGRSEEGVLNNYTSKLNGVIGQFAAANGRIPDGFGEFVVVNSSDLDSSNNKLISLLFARNGDPMCGVVAPADSDTTLVCNDVGLKRRHATYTLDNGVVTVTITPIP